jgi:hypothetical protein
MDKPTRQQRKAAQLWWDDSTLAERENGGYEQCLSSASHLEVWWSDLGRDEKARVVQQFILNQHDQTSK